MVKFNTIHIHSDEKFIHNSAMFEGQFFENTTIFVNSRTPSIILLDIQIFTTDEDDFVRILDLCNKADIVVIYDLTLFKCRLILAIQKHVKIVWRFFGYELYSKRLDLFTSDLSRQYYVGPTSLIKALKIKLGSLYQVFKNGYSYNGLFYKAVKRCNVFLGLSHQEYDLLKDIWPMLPTFVKLPHNHLKTVTKALDINRMKDNKHPIIIIGNSRSHYNNHLDVINIIDKYETRENYDFTLLFSYGSLNNYSNKVLDLVKNKYYFTVINEFISKEKFSDFYKKPVALVINAYRQLAGANIRMALENGMRIYMNNKNVHKKFLEDEGFIIFSMEDFEDDLANNKLKYDEVIARNNFENYQKFCKVYTKYDFQLKLIEVINN